MLVLCGVALLLYVSVLVKFFVLCRCVCECVFVLCIFAVSCCVVAFCFRVCVCGVGWGVFCVCVFVCVCGVVML